MRTLTLVLALLVSLPSLAERWVVWPDAPPELVAKTRAAVAKVAPIAGEAIAKTTFEQAEQIGATCGFGDVACLRRLMQLGEITHLVWVDKSPAKPGELRGLAFLPEEERTFEGPELKELVTRLVAPDKLVGTLVLKLSPEGATASIKGEPIKDESVQLKPGTYAVEVSAAGHEAEEHSVTITFGADSLLEVALQPEQVAVVDAGPTPVDAGPALPPDEGMSALGVSGISLVGVGVFAAGSFVLYAAASANGFADGVDKSVNTQAGLNAAAVAGVVGLLGAALFGVDLILQLGADAPASDAPASDAPGSSAPGA